MHESFGARLRRYREEQHVALHTIADQTKIKLSLLEDLERDDVSSWPNGIFRRSFIRAYALALNLDPDSLVREFCEVHPAPADVASAAAIAAAIEREGANGKTTSRFRTFMGSLGLGVQRTPPPEEHRPAPSTARRVEEHHPAFELNLSTPAQLPRQAPRIEVPEPAVAAPPAPVMRERGPEAVQPEVVEAIQEGVQVYAKEPVKEPAVVEPDFMAFAQICTEFARIESADDVPRLMREVARIMDASGLIVWVWDAVGQELRPALTHGYSSRVVAQLPGVGREDDNATAAAFRSGQPCVINGGDQCSAALVLPLVSPGGSAGVLAIELQQGRRLTKPIRAVATIFAAIMAQLVGGVSASDEDANEHRAIGLDDQLAHALNG